MTFNPAVGLSEGFCHSRGQPMDSHHHSPNSKQKRNQPRGMD